MNTTTDAACAVGPLEKLDLCLDKGAEFSSYIQLERVLEQRKLLFGERWRVGKSETAESSNKVAKATNLFPSYLKYSRVCYRCTHEGKFVPQEGYSFHWEIFNINDYSIEVPDHVNQKKIRDALQAGIDTKIWKQ